VLRREAHLACQAFNRCPFVEFRRVNRFPADFATTRLEKKGHINRVRLQVDRRIRAADCQRDVEQREAMAAEREAMAARLDPQHLQQFRHAGQGVRRHLLDLPAKLGNQRAKRRFRVAGDAQRRHRRRAFLPAAGQQPNDQAVFALVTAEQNPKHRRAQFPVGNSAARVQALQNAHDLRLDREAHPLILPRHRGRPLAIRDNSRTRQVVGQSGQPESLVGQAANVSLRHRRRRETGERTHVKHHSFGIGR